MTVLINLLDDSTRPKAPKIEGLSDQQRRHGQRLALIHAMYLRQLSQIRRVMEQVEASKTETEDLTAAISSMPMAENYRAFGNLCGQQCQLLTFHHTAEDQLVFPALMQGSEGLQKVVERLAAEHEIIHQLLDRLEAASAAIATEPSTDRFAQLKDVFDRLDRVVRSHFGYEEVELEEAIGYWNIPL